jgi:hypothetical protein
MKKIYMALAVATILATSCKKSYTCYCDITTPGTNGTASFTRTNTEVITETSTHSALTKCNADAKITASYSNATYSCTVQ